MPGVIMTEDGSRNGVPANHDRDRGLDGSPATGDAVAPRKMQALDSTKAPNGHGPEEARLPAAVDSVAPAPTKRSRMNDLPDEIVHIAEGYIPLSMLLSRLAQQTHNVIQEKVQQLARMPLPQPPASAVNGNSPLPGKDKEEFDNSHESLSKKVNLLEFIQTIHGKWVKALVIANWSRESEMVTKLIDLKSHINEQLLHFDMRLDQVIDLKRNLIFARIPSPDLRTALQVLSCGNGDWMPDLGYIEPPTVTLRDHAKWLEELDTCLSIRLNLHDFDNIPRRFKNYTIGSGRATFKVQGEFEVDLTVADDDPEKQFWFIDFRFDFTPAAESLSEHFKPMLEAHVNNALAKDGLTGCHDLLHEFVLSHKIGELRRQALELGRTSWANTIAVEPLDRSVSIQYWVTRQPQNTPSVPVFSRYAVPAVPTTPKSWIIISVSSGKRPDGTTDPKNPSRLTVTWYRDGKQMKGVEVDFDHSDLCTEKLLKSVIAKHIEHILTSVHKKLRSAPRFAKHEAKMDLQISSSEPGDSYLTMQLGPDDFVIMKMEPTTGKFTLYPHTKYSLQSENRLNNSGKDPSEDGAACLENLRWHHMTEEIARKGRPHGWTQVKSPLTHDDARLAFKILDAFHPVCFQRQGINSSWYAMLVMSLHGDQWWAFQTTEGKPSSRPVKHSAELRFDAGQPGLGPEFWNNLTTFFAGVIAHTVDLHALHSSKFRYDSQPKKNAALSKQVVVPSIFVKLSDVVPSAAESRVAVALQDGDRVQESRSDGNKGPKPSSAGPPGARKPWAKDFVELRYCGVQSVLKKVDSGDRHLTNNVDAIVRVVDRQKFSFLNTKLGQDVLYNPQRGELCIRLRGSVGEPLIQTMQTRLQLVDRVIDSLDAMAKAKAMVTCEKVTLEQVVFTYTDGVARPEGTEPKRWRVTLDLSKPRVIVHLDEGNPHLRAVDFITRLANGPSGISSLTTMLPLTLPILTTLERIQSTWRESSRAGKGSLTVQLRSLDWYSLRYDVPPLGNRPRTLKIDVRARFRHGKLWWHVHRPDMTHAESEQDIFGQRLRKVWDAKGAPWRALTTGAATEVDDRVLKLLLGLDQTVREAVLSGQGGGAPGSGGGAQGLNRGQSAQAEQMQRAQQAHHMQQLQQAQQAQAQQAQAQQAQQQAATGSRSKPVTLD